ncbi:VanZ family protein [Microbacterium sp. NPDC089321]|uniref:VanZ family protein n=1 Tax=Microbacterium sp. NPDC089321 TaxID=3155183 RepID=UPI00341F1CE8
MGRPVREQRPVRHPMLVSLLIACLIGGVAIVLLPIGWMLNRFVVWLYYAGRSIGVPPFVTIVTYDVALNVLLFAVPVALAATLWPRVRWWLWAPIALILSATVELVQFAALPRDASSADILVNTIGAVIGAGAAALVRKMPRRFAESRLRPPER